MFGMNNVNVTMVKENGESFTIEVNKFQTFLSVKEKIQTNHGIPVSDQSFFFDGQRLPDEETIIEFGLDNGSRIQLHVAPPEIINFQVKLPLFSTTIPQEMNLNDTVSVLKEKVIFVIEPWWRSVTDLGFHTTLQFSSSEGDLLFDHQTLRECEVSNGCVLYGIIIMILPQFGGSGRGGADDMSFNLTVVPTSKKEKFKIEIKVNGSDVLSDLRKKFDEFHHSIFLLPQDGDYFFVHNGNIMEETKSYLWHGVKDGDIIELYDNY